MRPLWTDRCGVTVSAVDRAQSLEELVRGWRQHAPDLLLHDPGGRAEAVVRRGELLIAAERAPDELDRLGRWVDDVHHSDGLGVARARLRRSERDRCVEIARDRSAGVAANHVHIGSEVLRGSPVMFGTGADVRDYPAVPAPAEELWDPPVSVGVLDTGLDPHPWFAGRPWFREVREELDADDDSGQDRQAGHGTFVAGVVLQRAPGAALRAHRALSSLGFTDDVRVAEGLRAIAKWADVVLVTSGCRTPDDECPPVLRAALPDGAVVVAAAGNHGSSRPFWPAALPEVLAVGAAGPDGVRAEFSNWGEWVDAAAPGVDVASSHVRLVPGEPDDRTYGCARWSGTSFAAPQIAGAVAAALHEGRRPGEAVELTRDRHPFGGT